MFGKKRIAELKRQLSDMQANHKRQLSDAVTQVVSTMDNGIRSRIAAIISGTNYTGDTLHNIAIDYGYPEIVSFEMLWNMYRRFGIAKNVVELPVEICWLNNPVITSSNGQFVRELETLKKQVKLYMRLKGLDLRQRIGRYAGMFMRVRDDKQPSEPLTEKLNGPASLMQMVPLYEGQLEVLQTDEDPRSERYSLPVMYQFSGSKAGNRNEDLGASFSIHWTRVVIAAEGADNGGIYGIPALEACFNSLMDLRKIIGGGAEGFYKNSSQSVVFNVKDIASAKNNETLLTKFNEQYDEFARNRARRGIWTPGMEAKTLESNLSSPKEHFAIALNDVAASSKIPATILIGQQTGRLASEQDGRGFLAGCNSRNTNYTSEMLGDILTWCMEYGVLPVAEYEVEWPDLLALSDSEKYDNAVKLAEVNAKQFTSGGDVPFSGDEIREAAGYEVEEE